MTTPAEKQDLSIVTSSREHDVTGGIQLKVDCAIEIVKESAGRTPVCICGLDSDAFESLIAGKFDIEDDLCTTITMNTV